MRLVATASSPEENRPRILFVAKGVRVALEAIRSVAESPTSHTEPHPYDVAIIGAGFAGTMVAVHLSQLALQLRTVLIDCRGTFGPGIAYSAESSQQLLNVPAGKMGAFPDQPEHFLMWVEDHRDEFARDGVEISASAFVPRQIYGRYLRDILEQAWQAAQRLETADVEIVDIEPGSEHHILIDRNARLSPVKAGIVSPNPRNYAPE